MTIAATIIAGSGFLTMDLRHIGASNDAVFSSIAAVIFVSEEWVVLQALHLLKGGVDRAQKVTSCHTSNNSIRNFINFRIGDKKLYI